MGARFSPPRLGHGMTTQPITYRGHTVAAATADRFILSDALERRPTGDPERTFVIYMCAYARDVLTGQVPGPYTDENAHLYASACVTPPQLLAGCSGVLRDGAPCLRLPSNRSRLAHA